MSSGKIRLLPRSVKIGLVAIAAGLAQTGIKTGLEFSGIKNRKVYPDLVSAHSGPDGDDLYFRGRIFPGVQPGDVVCRAVDTGWGSLPFRVINRVIAAGVPGFCEHASVYIGRGKVLNIGPDDPAHPIMEKDLEDLVADQPLDQVKVLRMDEDPEVRAQAVAFLRLHEKMAAGERFRFNFWPALGKRVYFSEPIYYLGRKFEYYYDRFNCIQGIFLAYRFAAPGLTVDRKSSVRCAASTLEYGYNPFLGLESLVSDCTLTGYDLLLASTEIKPR